MKEKLVKEATQNLSASGMHCMTSLELIYLITTSEILYWLTVVYIL